MRGGCCCVIIIVHVICLQKLVIYYMIAYKEGDEYMEYSKPVVIASVVVNGAKCGGGPCGRPR